MNGLELAVTFLAGVLMGGALDFFVLPLVVDAWIDWLRPETRAGLSDQGAGRPGTIWIASGSHRDVL